MTRSVKRYWKWDEKFNDTPYKLGSDINDLLQKGLVSPSIDSPSNFLGSPEGAPKYVEVVDGKVNFILFSSFQKIYLPIYCQRVVGHEGTRPHCYAEQIFEENNRVAFW